MGAVFRIASSLTAILLLVGLLAWYIGARAGWAFELSPRLRKLVLSVLGVGVIAAVLARTLGPEHADVAAPLGAFGGGIVLAVLISTILLLPVELLRAIAALVRRARGRRHATPQARDQASTASAYAASHTRDQAPALPAHGASQNQAPEQPTRRDFLARTATAGALTLGAGSSLYGTVIGRHDYTLETVPIKLAKLPRALDGLTIAQLSDIHVGTFVGERELSAAREFVQRAKPDLVVLTGDLLDHDLHYAPLLARFAYSLRAHARYGVYAVPGNHDHYAGAPTVLGLLREAGVDVLLNRSVRIGKGRDTLALAGVDDVAGPGFGSAGPRLDLAFAGVPDELARVLLNHNPAFFPQALEQADLTLSGHTHGGQITMFINPAELVLRHGLVRGHYASGASQLYVNRGFGTAGPPARIGSPPEITRLVLHT